MSRTGSIHSFSYLTHLTVARPHAAHSHSPPTLFSLASHIWWVIVKSLAQNDERRTENKCMLYWDRPSKRCFHVNRAGWRRRQQWTVEEGMAGVEGQEIGQAETAEETGHVEKLQHRQHPPQMHQQRMNTIRGNYQGRPCHRMLVLEYMQQSHPHPHPHPLKR
jgi:hypothetical protein